jgi:UDP-N-acetylglucosamine--N-acetylmuramyl-(pentapeptide) pyrophosphoryl-undecaprenol N-acetylglucosamine transferase
MDGNAMPPHHYILAAGGTGGHIMPANALAHELLARGHKVSLITDERGKRIPGLDPRITVHVIPSSRVGKKPWEWPKALRAIFAGRRMALRIYKTHPPKAVIGFGGYPAFPALLAAHALKIPSLVHEQNAVLGRANRRLVGKAYALLTAYNSLKYVQPHIALKTHMLGNPVRHDFAAIGALDYQPISHDKKLHLLVTGGSQGASIFNSLVPEALTLLEDCLRMGLCVTHQARAADVAATQARYDAAGVKARVLDYIHDMPQEMAQAALVIARAGASTIAELTCAGRPAILVPLPSAMDDHQSWNAQDFAAGGGALILPQAALTPHTLAQAIAALCASPETLRTAAMAAKACGKPDAAQRIADFIEALPNR